MLEAFRGRHLHILLTREGHRATDLDLILKNLKIKSLVVTGVTTEVCVQTTMREANDRGYECLVLEDCVASYFPEFQKAAIDMIKAQGRHRRLGLELDGSDRGPVRQLSHACLPIFRLVGESVLAVD